MTLDSNACYRALASRDARFDGLFFVGVTTTGIYCRPVCRARTPGAARCRYFTRAVEAEREGFRACFRCRPELAPGRSSVDALSRLVRAACARIEEGALNDGSLATLAAELGVTPRHLRRAMAAELGVSPVELAQSRRLGLAKSLLQDGALALADVAFASGFGSVRRFNALFRARFGRTPSEVRRAHTAEPRPRAANVEPAPIVLRLGYRPPFAWGALCDFLAARAIESVERVSDGRYARTVALGDARGFVTVEPRDGEHALEVRASIALAPVLMAVVARLRRLFDLDAEPALIDATLARDALLAPSVRALPGMRVPGAFDAFEILVRAILGQQVSVAGATTLARRLVARFGDTLAHGPAGLERTFPSAAALHGAGAQAIGEIGLPAARARTIALAAAALVRGVIDLGVRDADELAKSLTAIAGIGPWTAAYVAMRLGAPDAFPETDLGLARALGPDRAAARARAEGWRPWRAYAALHVWHGGSTGEAASDAREA